MAGFCRTCIHRKTHRFVSSLQKARFQASGSSESEPPSKSMSWGTGIMQNDVFVMPCMAKYVKISHKWLSQACHFRSPCLLSLTSYASKNSTKSALSGLGTIKIGTTMKSYVWWYRYHGKWWVFHVSCEQTCEDNSWLVSQPSPFPQPLPSLQMGGPKPWRNFGWLTNNCSLRHTGPPCIEGCGSSP